MTAKRPERKKPFRSFVISGKAEKFAPLIIILLFAITARDLLSRPLWFDEALTVLNFALLDTPEKIYHSYIIPNNQIIHSIFLHWWIKIFSFDFLRLFPFLCGILCLTILWQLRKKSGSTATFVTLAVLSFSYPFAVYGTALRGYMLAAMTVAGGAWMVTRYLDSGKKRFLAGWFIFSLSGVGTMPGTLAGLAGAMLYAMGYCRWTIFKQWRLYLAGIMPLAAFAIFYLPIKDNLLRCAALGEGWKNGSAMLLALVMGVLFTNLPFVIAAALGKLKPFRFSPKIFHLLIWLLPIPAAYIFKVAPFPRVFFPLFPVFALVLADGMKDFLALMQKKRGKKYAGNILIAVMAASLLWSVACKIEFVREKISALHPCPGGQEDFIDCHFTKQTFSPHFTARNFKEYFPHAPEVYATFDSDPWALMYAFMENGVESRLFFDGPGGQYPGIPPVAIKHFTEDKRVLETRFNCRFTEVFTTDNHTFLVPEK